MVNVYFYLILALQVGIAAALFRKNRYWSWMMLAGPLVNIIVNGIVWNMPMRLSQMETLKFVGCLATLSFFSGLVIHAANYRMERRRMAELERIGKGSEAVLH